MLSSGKQEKQLAEWFYNKPSSTLAISFLNKKPHRLPPETGLLREPTTRDERLGVPSQRDLLQAGILNQILSDWRI